MHQIAKVLKSNGIDGGLLLGFRDIDPEDINLKEPVFIYFDGLPVPFFIQSLNRRGTNKAIVYLNDITSLKDAEEVVGREVFSEQESFVDDSDGDLSALVGWTVAQVGEITDFIDIAANPCIEVQTEKGAVLIPLHEDFIISMDPDTKTIEMDIPEGLLDL